MKLYYADASPYARKVRVAALLLGVELELVPTNTLAAESDFGRINPVHRVPALQLDSGKVLIDSPLIVEYLDATYGPKLIPVAGEARWEVLLLQAFGDGLMDAAVPRRYENVRPPEQQSPDRLRSYKRSMDQTMDHLERNAELLAGVDAGTIAIACALAYVSFRHRDDEWEKTRPRLAAWHREFSTLPAMQATSLPG